MELKDTHLLHLTLLPECQSEIIQLHPDLTSCDLSIKK